MNLDTDLIYAQAAEAIGRKCRFDLLESIEAVIHYHRHTPHTDVEHMARAEAWVRLDSIAACMRANLGDRA